MVYQTFTVFKIYFLYDQCFLSASTEYDSDFATVHVGARHRPHSQGIYLLSVSTICVCVLCVRVNVYLWHDWIWSIAIAFGIHPALNKKISCIHKYYIQISKWSNCPCIREWRLMNSNPFHDELQSVSWWTPVCFMMNSNPPTINFDLPLMNSDPPTMNSDLPLMNSNPPTMNSDLPLMNSNHPPDELQFSPSIFPWWTPILPMILPLFTATNPWSWCTLIHPTLHICTLLILIHSFHQHSFRPAQSGVIYWYFLRWQ